MMNRKTSCSWVVDIIDDLIDAIPDSAWDSVPRDLAETIDDRLYGEVPERQRGTVKR